MQKNIKLIIGGAVIAVLAILVVLFNTVLAPSPKVDDGLMKAAADAGNKAEPPPPPEKDKPQAKAKPRGMGG